MPEYERWRMLRMRGAKDLFSFGGRGCERVGCVGGVLWYDVLG